MTARQIIVPGAMPSRDANGRALPAKLRFYTPNAALTTPATVYTDETLTVAHPFPILSDAAGRWPSIWADEDDSFDVGWSDQTFDATISTFTGVTPANDAVLASVTLAQMAADAAEAAALMVQAVLTDLTGNPLTATSGTNITIGAAGQQRTLKLDQDGRLFTPGQIIVAAVDPSLGVTKPLNQMVGTVLGLDEDMNLTFQISTSASPDGVGPYAKWQVGLSGPGSVQSVAGLTGIIGAAALRAALVLTAADITDFNQKADARVIGLAQLLS